MSVVVRNLLVIDRNESDVLELKGALRKSGLVCDVIWLPGHEEALHFLSTYSRCQGPLSGWVPHITFVGIEKRDFSGLKVLEYMAERLAAWPKPHIVVLSSSSNGDIAPTWLRYLRADDYASKPMDSQFFEALALKHGFEWLRVKEHAESSR